MNASEEVGFLSGDLMLEGRLRSASAKFFLPGVILCHPHPLFGGSMDNNVVAALEAELTMRGIPTLAFNFRGVGKSQGRYDSMRGEVEDVLAALDFMAERPEIDPARLAIVGYSFGGLMAMYAAGAALTRGKARAVKALALVSPMSPGMPWTKDRRLKDLFEKPPAVLVTAGTQDRFCPVNAARDLATELGMNTRLVILEGGDHFYIERENEAAQPAGDLMANVL